MKVVELMNSRVITAPISSSLIEVWDLISRKHIHGLPIVDEKGCLKGIIAEEDILNKLYPDYTEVITDPDQDIDANMEDKLAEMGKMKAGKVMNTRVIYTRSDTSLMRALSRMIVHKVRQLPVINDESKVIGIISKGDIFDALFNLRSISLQSTSGHK
ncbi:CBS domain-containing protein [Candidatus Gottesmanbacteria bacterium]|nr:CBS domain-containing protein [Candidatus Gottesmanbacteria bacterium]